MPPSSRPADPETPASAWLWSRPESWLLNQLHTTPHGLPLPPAQRRSSGHPRNRLQRIRFPLGILLRQFGNPLVLLLLLAAGLAYHLGDRLDAWIILGIVSISGLLGFAQEFRAANAMEALERLVQIRTTILQDDQPVEIPADQVLPGDIVVFHAGDVAPADCRLLSAKDLFADESVLTGEAYPVEKRPGTLPDDTPVARRTNVVFEGTHLVSGSGRALVVRTGSETEFGRIAARLRFRPPETEFERGLRQFGYLLLETTLLLVFGIFAANVLLQRPSLDSLLFALALAVGLTPQLLPAIVSVNLAYGARRMGEQQVVVKRLTAIEDLGSVQELCTDKTGTLTEGKPRLHAAEDVHGHASDTALRYAFLNAAFQTGFENPLDAAIRQAAAFDLSECELLDEVPYDFVRKRLTVLIRTDGRSLMITKGAVPNILEICSHAANGESKTPREELQDEVQSRVVTLGQQGFRVLGIACRDLGDRVQITRQDEERMCFVGLLAFFDPPRADAASAIHGLQELGVRVRIITGDHAEAARAASRLIGLDAPNLLTGPEMHQLSDAALMQRAPQIDVFAEIEPNEKERLILALRKAGSVVGYLGDGINDAPALHAADVGISVSGAADVAQQAADVVLLKKDLEVIREGIVTGRTTFANTLKYIFMATSANFGNMFSMAGASLLLPFLPLLPKQILLTNLLTDIPELTISTDTVDPEWVAVPRRWSLAFIRRFMLVFGLISSLFDYLSFGVLLYGLHASPAQFHTGWFQESVISAVMVVLVVRTRQKAWESRPSRQLIAASIAIVLFTTILPWLPGATALGFTPLPAAFYPWLAGIVLLYFITAEAAKHYFYRRFGPEIRCTSTQA